MRHYYDSLSFPFLTDLLFDQLTNWDWANTRKEIEEAKKQHADPKKMEELYQKQLSKALNLGTPWYRANRFLPY